MHEEPEGYDGQVTVGLVDDRTTGDRTTGERTTAAALAARFDPLAGRVTWSGRLGAELPLRATVLISTPYGSATARTTERDVWGNTRVTGLDRPPFPVELLGR
jgi:hypothetical protein